MAAWSIRRVTFSNSQHWQPMASITELQGFLGSTVANSTEMLEVHFSAVSLNLMTPPALFPDKPRSPF